MLWPQPDKDTQPRVVSEFGYGHSVYALAVSPSGTKLAAGTKQGMLRVYGLMDGQVQENSVPLFEVYHPPFVSSLAFLTDDILASGSLNGQIKVWSLSGREKRAAFSAHPAGVISLCRLGSLVLASIGKDAILRIWDMDTLEERYVSEPFGLPEIRTLISLDYHVYSGLLMHASGSGDIHIYAPQKNFEHRTIRAHQGDFCALACGCDYTVTAGLKDTMIKLWPSSMDEPLAELSAPLGIWSVAWAGIHEVITAYTDGSSQVWKLEGRLLAGPRYPHIDFRTVVGLPPAMIMRRQLEIRRRRRDEMIAKAKRIMTDSGSRKELKRIIDGLCEDGFSVEACLMLTEAARLQKKPLWELECLLCLIQALNGHPAAVPPLYALAVLLRRLHEPLLAKEYFQRILQTDVHFPGVFEQMEQLTSDPFMILRPESDVRADLRQEKRLLQELEKYSILSKKFTWSLVLQTANRYDCKRRLNPHDIVECVSKALEKHDHSDCRVEWRELALFDGNHTRKITCVYIRSVEASIAVALEICSGVNETGFIPHEILETSRLGIPSDWTAPEHNHSVQTHWRTIRHGDAIETWLNTMCNVSFAGIQRLIRRPGY